MNSQLQIRSASAFRAKCACLMGQLQKDDGAEEAHHTTTTESLRLQVLDKNVARRTTPPQFPSHQSLSLCTAISTMPFTTILTSLTSTLFNSLAPYHLLLHSTLLGSSLYQTFINTKVCFNALPRSAFRTLQKRIFPVYFRSQLLLILLSILTVPPHGIISLRERKADWISYLVAAVTTGLNLVVFEPRTKTAMVECMHQGLSPCHRLRLRVLRVSC